MSNQDQKVSIPEAEVRQASDNVAGSAKSIKTLFSMDLLGKPDAQGSKDTPPLPLMSLVDGDGKVGTSSAPLEHHLASVLAPLTPAEVKISNGPQKQQHQFKPFKLPNGRIENTGYVQDSPADMEKFYAKSGLWQIRGSASTDNAKDLTKWTNLPGAADTSPAAASRSDTSHVALPAVDTHRDAVAPSVQQIADSAPPSEPTQIIINSGAGSRAQLFNRGPRVEQSVTAPPSAAPSEVPTQTPSVPSADVPQPQPYSGPGSRARLFREQPRN